MPTDPDDPRFADDALTRDQHGDEREDVRAGRFRGWPDGALRKLRANRRKDA